MHLGVVWFTEERVPYNLVPSVVIRVVRSYTGVRGYYVLHCPRVLRLEGGCKRRGSSGENIRRKGRLGVS